MLRLRSDRRNVTFMLEGLLLRCRARLDTAVAAVIADSILRPVYDCSVVDIVYLGDVHIHHSSVVEKVSAVPAAACEAHAEVTEAVINAAVEPDMRPPEALVKEKS